MPRRRPATAADCAGVQQAGCDGSQTGVRAVGRWKLWCITGCTARLFTGLRFLRLHATQPGVIIVCGLCLLLTGCGLSARHRLEASLRENEASIRDLQQELASAQQQLRDQEDELGALKQPKGDSQFHTASSGRALETEIAWGAVDKIRIHSLTSGILRADNQLTMNIVVQPLDRDGEVVKVAGELLVQVQQPGQAALLAESSVSSLESRSAWSNGIIARGFQIEVPLPDSASVTLPPDSKVLVTATLKLNAERSYQATELLQVPR